MEPSQPATARRLRVLTLGAAFIAVVAVLMAVRFVPWELRQPSNRASPPGVEGEIRSVETEGSVRKIERERRTIHVSSGVLGFGSTVLAVSDETRIIVGEKEGGFGDIWEGLRVRASYEIRPGMHVAKTIEVLVKQETAERPSWLPAPAANVVSPSRADREKGESPFVVRSEGKIAPPSGGAPAVISPEDIRRSATRPDSKRREPTPRPVAAEMPERRSSSGAEMGRPTLPPTDRTDTDPSDPAAVIDWLLRESSTGKR